MMLEVRPRMSESAGVVEVAARAGVSLGTVSNVLNHPDRVAPATRDRVMRAIHDLGFVRNEAARQLRAGRSRTIGLVVLDVGNPFFTDLAKGVEATAGRSGLSVVLCNSNDDEDREQHYLSLLQEQRAFGILITPVGQQTAPIDAVRRTGTPVVLVDRGSNRRQCSVSVNDRVGGELAVAHLIRCGHRRIGFVGGPMSINQVGERLAGARAAIRAAGLRDDALVVLETPHLDVASGRATGDRIAALPARRRPTAVFCANDLLALGLLQDTTRRQKSVPGDLAIVGYDDIDFAAAAAVPLTSVRQPRAQLGRAAMELLLEEATDPTGHQHRQVVFEPELVVRESTTP
jgi:LacI family transcriptional regulator